MSLGTTALRHPLAVKKVALEYQFNDVTRLEIFEVFARYELGDPIAKGTYGYVAGAIDSEGPEDAEGNPACVAIKKIPHLFDHGNARMWLCAARELQMMRRFNHPNVMRAEDIFVPLGDHNNLTLRHIMDRKKNFEEIYIVMSMMSNSLRGLLNQQDVVEVNGERRQPLEFNARTFLLFQLLAGMGYLHKCGVMHRDMKPENTLIDECWNAKICDFGQGRGFGNREMIMTVMDNCTQWYAAPETVSLRMGELAVGTMDKATFHSADVWSLGCIAAEMLIGKPLFEAARAGGLEQLCAIMRVLGKPTEEEVESLVRTDADREEYKLLERRATGFPETSQLRDVLKCPLGEDQCNDDEVELIIRMLQYDPKRRITIAEALSLPLFETFAQDEQFRDAINPQADLFPIVQQSDLETDMQGREFIWNLFIERHPEVQELIEALEEAEKVRKSASGAFEKPAAQQ